MKNLTCLSLCGLVFVSLPSRGSEPGAPSAGQLPLKMHVAMSERPRVAVGQEAGDFRGKDNRALQAAVDYVASLGGGTVEIGAGTYDMHDSLHLRPNLTVRGVAGKTILRKMPSQRSALALDGDYGEEQVTLENPEGFEVGRGITIWDKGSGGFHTTVARIIGRTGNTFALDRPLNSDYMAGNGAQAATVFPVVSAVNAENVRIENLVVDGNKAQNTHLNGCRGAGIYLYRGFSAVISNCTVHSYNGDGISFQQSNDVSVEGCISEDNASLGLHPGSGSQRPIIRDCVARRNGEDGLFLCWRVRHGVFEKNLLEDNGRFGISIGHKDTDNLLRKNTVRLNHQDGVCFRDETFGMAGHRNRLEENLIENNGVNQAAAGIRVRGATHDVVLKNNIIRETRDGSARNQNVGVKLEEKVGPIKLEQNQIDASTPLQDGRKQ